MQNDLTLPIYRLSSSIVTYINNELRKYHLTFQQLSILIFIDKQDKEVNVKDIGIYFGISHPTAVGLVSRMVRHSFLIISTYEFDRRQTIVVLSQNGKEILEKTKGILQNINTCFYDEVGKERFEEFIEMILSLERIFKV